MLMKASTNHNKYQNTNDTHYEADESCGHWISRKEDVVGESTCLEATSPSLVDVGNGILITTWSNK